MTEEDKKNVALSQRDPGFFQNLTHQVRLVLRLMGDSRVSPMLKMLPIGSIVYLLFPDLVPGPIDDAFIIGLGTYVFVEWCPPHVVAEHKAALLGEEPASAVAPADEPDVVDAEFVEGGEAE